MNILLIGGTGIISMAISKKLIENKENTLYLLNRGTRNAEIGRVSCRERV